MFSSIRLCLLVAFVCCSNGGNKVFGAFGFDNHTNQPVWVFLLTADDHTVRWTSKQCPPGKKIAFDAGAFHGNQTYWVGVARGDGKSPDGRRVQGAFLQYYPGSIEVPPGNGKVDIGKEGVRKLLANDWTDFKRATGNTTHYNAIVMQRKPGNGTVEHNNLRYNGEFFQGYGKIGQSDATYGWIDEFKN